MRHFRVALHNKWVLSGFAADVARGLANGLSAAMPPRCEIQGKALANGLSAAMPPRCEMQGKGPAEWAISGDAAPRRGGSQRLCRPVVRYKARALPNGRSAAMPPRCEARWFSAAPPCCEIQGKALANGLSAAMPPRCEARLCLAGRCPPRTGLRPRFGLCPALGQRAERGA